MLLDLFVYICVCVCVLVFNVFAMPFNHVRGHSANDSHPNWHFVVSTYTGRNTLKYRQSYTYILHIAIAASNSNG